MQKELSIPLSNSSAQQLVWPRRVGIILAGSALVAVCAHISLPLYFTPVPLTLQPFAVLLLGLLLAPRLATATLGTYLLEGAAGLPVFTPSALTGIAHLFGPTGGYLLSYPLAAGLIALLWRRGSHSFAQALWSAAAGNLVILGCGALWLEIWTHLSIRLLLTESVLPFLAGDALKVAVAAAVATGWMRLRSRTA